MPARPLPHVPPPTGAAPSAGAAAATPTRRQFGARCPRLLTDSHHGTWTFVVDVPAPLHRRTTVRRGGFAGPDAAEAALRTFLEGEAGEFDADPNQTVADYLNTWLTAKALVLKPTTMARHRDYVHNDLAPAFGSLGLDELRHRHISASSPASSPPAAAAPPSTAAWPRCPARWETPSASTASPQPRRPPALRRPPAPERRIWIADEAVRFLQYCHQADPDMADLFEFLIGTGLRKDEALGLATTSPPGTRKAALPHTRERPPTCIKAGRDDRI